MSELGPRIVIGGTASGVGKTTVATGLLAALARRGTRVAGAKVGPDFIDPGYHALASGRPPRNLDPWLCGVDAIAPLTARAGTGSELLVIEGVMGLFDGAADGTPSSTADVARLLDAPILLVVDASAMSASVAAVVRGFRDHDPRVRIAGVVLNRVGSPGHEEMLRDALEELRMPVVGVLHRDDALVWRDRHLGLVPVAERPDDVRASLDRLAALVTDGFDLDTITKLARAAPVSATRAVRLPQRVGSCRLAVAAGPAFTFAYTDNLEAFEAAGAELVPFDPLLSEDLPHGVDGVFIGGGFPEVYAEALAANSALLDDVRTQITAGLPTWAECGGLVWLAEKLDDRPMAGIISATATMTSRLTLGYREARLQVDTPIGSAGCELRGHEFHYSTCSPAGHALSLTSRFGDRLDGFATPRLLATYLHHHAGGDPSCVAAFVQTCAAQRAGRFPRS